MYIVEIEQGQTHSNVLVFHQLHHMNSLLPHQVADQNGGGVLSNCSTSLGVYELPTVYTCTCTCTCTVEGAVHTTSVM